MAFKSDKQRKGFFSSISTGGNASVRKIQKKDKKSNIKEMYGVKWIKLDSLWFIKNKNNMNKYGIYSGVTSKQLNDIDYLRRISANRKFSKYYYKFKDHKKALIKQKKRSQYKKYSKPEKGFIW